MLTNPLILCDRTPKGRRYRRARKPALRHNQSPLRFRPAPVTAARSRNPTRRRGVFNRLVPFRRQSKSVIAIHPPRRLAEADSQTEIRAKGNHGAGLTLAMGRPFAPGDCQIAAIARARDMAVATRSVRDFESVGIEVVDPWAIA